MPRQTDLPNSADTRAGHPAMSKDTCRKFGQVHFKLPLGTGPDREALKIKGAGPISSPLPRQDVPRPRPQQSQPCRGLITRPAARSAGSPQTPKPYRPNPPSRSSTSFLETATDGQSKLNGQTGRSNGYGHSRVTRALPTGLLADLKYGCAPERFSATSTANDL